MLFDIDFWSILIDLGKKNETPREATKGQRPKFFRARSSWVALGGLLGLLGLLGAPGCLTGLAGVKRPTVVPSLNELKQMIEAWGPGPAAYQKTDARGLGLLDC